jgi:hypothetical protein
MAEYGTGWPQGKAFAFLVVLLAVLVVFVLTAPAIAVVLR